MSHQSKVRRQQEEKHLPDGEKLVMTRKGIRRSSEGCHSSKLENGMYRTMFWREHNRYICNGKYAEGSYNNKPPIYIIVMSTAVFYHWCQEKQLLTKIGKDTICKQMQGEGRSA